MGEWQNVKIKDICNLKRGASPRPISDPKYFGGGAGWIRISDVTSSKNYLRTTEQKLSLLGESKSVKVHPDEVIMSICATIGRPVIVDVEACIHDGFVVFKDLNKNVDNKYFLYFLKAKEEYFNSLGQHGTQKNLNTGIVNMTEILLPPLQEQQKIAVILSSVDEAIEKTEAIIEKTEKVKKGLMQQLFTKGIGHTKFKKTEIGEIPEEWELVKLEDIATVDRGKFSHRPRNDPRFYGGNIPFVQTGDVTKAKGYLKVHSQTLNKQGLGVSKLFPKGTIIITIAANIGETAIASYDVCFPDSLVGIVPNENVNTNFLEFYLRTKKDYLDKNATESAQKNINLQVLKPLLVPIPSKNEQDEIAAILKSLEEKIMLETGKMESLSVIKKGLMQDLLTGKVRVKIDEAEVTQV
ncbi:restriction endonuclease subunit S [Bacillus wiedmannii]|uniref:restriction endonuclease subunit S n=1 Tax=Bacillus wiedmannii TaxID=1890302 RepID=UPI000BF1C475|nr:restriction endonuclease subunit S [Bacillus wiedmannii]PEJ53997.1 type I site-specific deoxyribonuclease [Bacillus wiedmannii]PGD10529.1 type I site-specific deoxyribonuclease [Bacillus wiedmannii]